MSMSGRLARGHYFHRIVPLFIVALLGAFLLHTYHLPHGHQDATKIPTPTSPQPPPGIAKSAQHVYTKTIVMARTKDEDITWVSTELSDFNHTIYTVDDHNSSAEFRVPQNKGHEAMAYLTYIIDHYDRLPDVVLFFHPHQSTWHNNVLLDLDSAKTIRRLNLNKVVREGYFNARCHHDPGCPDWLHVDRPQEQWDLVKKKEEQYLTGEVWRDLHGGDPVPSALSQPCCAQFVVSGERIRARPLADFHRYREWLMNTNMSDSFSGRMLEYNWQYIFTGQAEFCPPQHECYCDGFGICFGGTNEDALQGWLDLLKHREWLDERLLDLRRQDLGREGGGRAVKVEIKVIEGEKVEVMARLDKLKAEAYRRGEDPRERALECGRV